MAWMAAEMGELRDNIEELEQQVFDLDDQLDVSYNKNEFLQDKVAALTTKATSENHTLRDKCMIYLDIISELEKGLAMYAAKMGVSLTSTTLKQLKRKAGMI